MTDKTTKEKLDKRRELSRQDRKRLRDWEIQLALKTQFFKEDMESILQSEKINELQKYEEEI
ncbi:hypothetical protein [uncultured Treponema sp.]|uniref:hypothetical protein n=1 Tax=uncultured Treponema sp. TaxID=162155 RepID=UPI0025827D00|nr:hypothetical protein [uncultured Treponema sp.]